MKSDPYGSGGSNRMAGVGGRSATEVVVVVDSVVVVGGSVVVVVVDVVVVVGGTVVVVVVGGTVVVVVVGGTVVVVGGGGGFVVVVGGGLVVVVVVGNGSGSGNSSIGVPEVVVVVVEELSEVLVEMTAGCVVTLPGFVVDEVVECEEVVLAVAWARRSRSSGPWWSCLPLAPPLSSLACSDPSLQGLSAVVWPRLSSAPRR